MLKNNDFYNDFVDFINLSILGINKRINSDRNRDDEIEDLIYPCARGAALNFIYGLFNKECSGILPQNEYELFSMFKEPLEVILNKLPVKYQEDINKIFETMECSYPYIEEIEKGIVVFSEDGEEILKYSKIINRSKGAIDYIEEYRGQRIFEEMCKTDDYVFLRSFLENPENVYIKKDRIFRSDEQEKFITANKELFQLCYVENTKNKIYKCENCGLVLKENTNGKFSCISNDCNKLLDKRTLIDINQPVYIMNNIVARNIYYPGRLERNIKSVLDEAVKKGRVKEYEMWPGKNDRVYDTWDFKVKLNDSLMFGSDLIVIDAKDVKNPKWIIEDDREQLEGAKFIYIVPNIGRSKDYVESVNRGCNGEAQCFKLKDFKHALLD